MKMNINGTVVTNDTPIQYKTNPKRAGFKSYDRYSEYEGAKTIGEYFELSDKKYSKADLRYDEDHGFLMIFNSDGVQINGDAPTVDTNQLDLFAEE